MRIVAKWLLGVIAMTVPMQNTFAGEEPNSSNKPLFTSFTGKITRNKVRLRLQPNLDGQIIKELSKGDLLVVVGEEDEFYAVEAPRGTKAYVFRTYVLDNTIEGSHVNVRLDPDTESPVIAQLNTGDKVSAVISPLNSKWMEITPPQSVRFFVCKEYVDNVGNAAYITTSERRLEEVNTLLNATNLISQSELQKPFEEINLDTVFSNLNKITTLYTDFPDQAARAKEMLARIHDAYLHKKVAYLEAKTAALGHTIQEQELSAQIRHQEDQLSKLEHNIVQSQPYVEVAKEKIEATVEIADAIPHPQPHLQDWNQAFDEAAKSENMQAWIPQEKELYEAWSTQHDGDTLANYYDQQYKEALVIRGIIEPYRRSIKNKPGDYILVNKGTNLPIAYLYSTQVNLEDYIGKEITMRVNPRPNNHFAFPAYFVIALE